MHYRMNRKSTLLATSASTALVLAALALPNVVAAQAFQASPSVVQGGVSIFDTSGESTITVDGMNAVIDWTPIEDVNGDALTFLPSGNTATFQNGFVSSDFAVINRILPSTNGNVVQFDGAVISQIQPISGPPTTGGQHIMFYSPTGIMVGGSATFDVGSLVMTTLAPDIASYEAFVTNSGPLQLTGVPDDQTMIETAFGAQFNAAEENSYVVFAAPAIGTSADVFVNGSIAFVAAQEVTLAHSSGLFDIVIQQGTNGGSPTPLYHGGNTGGPASSAAGDHHVIYGVAGGQSNDFSMFFTGNLGFDAAVTAGVEDGVVVLSANYNVSGTNVLNDLTASSRTSGTLADITISSADITGDLIAHSSDYAEISANESSTFIDGDVFLYGSQISQVIADVSGSVRITGDAIVSASVTGNSVPNPNIPADLDGQAGIALISALDFGVVQIDGNASIEAIGRMGLDNPGQFAGSAFGGTAEASGLFGGVLRIGGTLDIDASGLPATTLSAFATGGSATGGFANLLSDAEGLVEVNGDVSMFARGTALDLTATSGIFPAGTGFGGSVSVEAANQSQITIGTLLAPASLTIDASASGSTFAGSFGGGAAGGPVTIEALSSAILVTGDVDVMANALGGAAQNGGDATGGNVLVRVNSVDSLASFTVGADAAFTSSATGGLGETGGGALGGNLSAIVDSGLLDTGSLDFTTSGEGGSASGGNGGSGGNGTGGMIDIDFIDNADVTSPGGLFASSTGTGGISALGDGGSGTGGLIALSVLASSLDLASGNMGLLSQGTGGSGPVGGSATVGNIGLTFENGALFTAGNVSADAVAFGGTGTNGAGGVATGTSVEALLSTDVLAALSGGFALATTAEGGEGNDGDGGSATVGSATLRLIASSLTMASGQLDLQASALGGDAATMASITFAAGDATGGLASLDVTDGSFLSAGSVQMQANLTGGFGSFAQGGDASGGSVAASIDGSGSTLAIGLVGRSLFRSTVRGGATTAGDGIGGTATGDTVNLTVSNLGTLTFAPTNNPDLIPIIAANTLGGNSSVDGGAGGAATGGTATLAAILGGTLTAGTIRVETATVGGSGTVSINNVTGGAATGGAVAIDVLAGATFDAALLATTLAFGGEATGNATGGVATGSSLNMLIDQSDVDLSGQSELVNLAEGGLNEATGAGGNAIGGTISVQAQQGSSLSFDEAGSLLAISNQALGGSGTTAGGNATTGLLSVLFDSSPVTGIDLVVRNNAASGSNSAATTSGSAQSGTAVVRFGPGLATIDSVLVDTTATSLGIGTGGQAQVVAQGAGASLVTSALTVHADADVPITGTGTAGTFRIEALNGGSLSMATLEASALDLGDETAETHNSRLQALSGGQIRVSDNANVVSNGNIAVDTASGGQILGGADLANLTAFFEVFSYNLLRVTGDNPSLPALAADTLSLTSADIDIAPGAFLFAPRVSLSALDGVSPALVGGTISGDSYTLTQTEFDRIETASFSFNAFGDLELTDLAIDGSLAPSGKSNVGIYANRDMTITGLVDYSAVAATDELFIGSGNILQIVLPTGGISMVDDDVNSPGLAGTLFLGGRSIFAADANLLGLIGSDPDSIALGPLLLGSGTNTVDGSFIFADRVEIAAGDHILTQNTGVGTVYSGIIVGPGGLRIRQEGDFGSNGPMRVITYGARDNGDGTFTTNDDFFALVDFSATILADEYTTDATLNECNIITGDCAAPPPPPPPPPPEPEITVPLTSVDYVEPPEVVTSGDALVQVEQDAAFGMEFPLNLNPPPVGDQGVVDDPVTSGGDSFSNGQPDSEDEE